MRFELKGYDVTYDKRNNEAIVYKDNYEVLQVGFDENVGIYDIIGGVAVCMAQFKLLGEDDIEDVIETCGMSMDAVRDLIRGMTESMQRVSFNS